MGRVVTPGGDLLDDLVDDLLDVLAHLSWYFNKYLGFILNHKPELGWLNAFPCYLGFEHLEPHIHYYGCWFLLIFAEIFIEIIVISVNDAESVS